MSCRAPGVTGMDASRSRSHRRPSRRDIVGATIFFSFVAVVSRVSGDGSESCPEPHTFAATAFTSAANAACAAAAAPCLACGAMHCSRTRTSASRCAPKNFARVSESVSDAARNGGGALARLATRPSSPSSAPRPSRYRTLLRQIATDCARFSRTLRASISASPSPNGGGFHDPPLRRTSFADDARCSSRMSRGSRFSSNDMNSAKEPTYRTSQSGTSLSKPRPGRNPIDSSASIAVGDNKRVFCEVDDAETSPAEKSAAWRSTRR